MLYNQICLLRELFESRTHLISLHVVIIASVSQIFQVQIAAVIRKVLPLGVHNVG